MPANHKKPTPSAKKGAPRAVPVTKLKLDRPIVLIGLMGAGKTTVGKRLAKRLGLEFIDSDDAIAEAAGCSVADIFGFYGEGIFRDLELRVMKRLLTETKPHVLATGGGAFIQPEVRALIKRHGLSIWLRAELDVLVDRVSRRNTRPLLEKGDKKQILDTLMEQRYPVYGEAHITIDSGKGPHTRIVEDVVAVLKQRQGA